MKKYPSDISHQQFNRILPELEQARKKTKPRQLDLYQVFNGLLYVMRTGCQWRALPKDYPKWRSVHNYFLIWSEDADGQSGSTLDRVLKKIGRQRAYQQWQAALHQHGYC